MTKSDFCDECGVKRPSWLGGFHKCPKVGLLYYIGHHEYRITEEGLAWLTQ